MACKYTYKGREFSKDELIKQLASDGFTEFGGLNNIYKSIATTKKKKMSDLLSDTNLMLKQRYRDANNMLQAINNDATLSKAEKFTKKAEYKKIMREISKTISDLNDADVDKQVDFILGQALIDADMVEGMYTNNEITFNDLQFANSIVETWSNVYKVLGIESSTDIKNENIRKKIQDVDGRYSDLSKKSRRIAIELVKESTGLSEADITKMVDTSFFTEWARELSTTGIALPNKLAFTIKKVNTKINMEHNKNERTIEAAYEKIKDHSEIKANGFDTFFRIDKDKDGVETMALVSRYSPQFSVAKRTNNAMLRKDIERANGDEDLIKKAWQRYNAWNEANTIAFNSLLFLNPASYTDLQRANEVSKMIALGFTKLEVDGIIAESQKMYEKFEIAKEEYRYDIGNQALSDPSVVPQNMTYDEYIDMKMIEFDNMNNPLKYMDQKFFGAQKITAYGGAKYSYLVAAKTVKGKATEYYDPKFVRISNDPRLLEFYNWWTGFIKDSLKWLPQEDIDDLGPDFLPVLADRTVKEYGLTSMKETVAGLGDWFLNSLSVSNFERIKDINPFSKKERFNFEAKFLSENVPVEDRSKDMVLMAKMFSDMALVYKHKNTVKAEIDTMVDIIQNTEGSYVKNKKLGKLEASEKDATRIKSLVEHTVIKSFYGIKGEDELWKSDRLFYDWKELASLGKWSSEDAKKAKQLADDIKSMNNRLDTETLTDDERAKLEEEVKKKEEEYYALGGRNFSLTKTIDTAISNTRLLSLGFSPFSAVRNLLVGKINNRVHSNGGRDFNAKELAKANQILLESSGKYFSFGNFQTKNTKLIFGLLSDAGLAEGEDGMYLKALVNKKTTIDKFREMLPTAYTWLSSGDFHFKAEMMIAAMHHDKIKTKDGRQVPFYETLTEDREYDVSKYGEWDAKANGNKTFEDFYITKLLKYKQLANKLHGATGRDVVIKAKSNAIGRMLILFKSWLPETLGVRFDPKHTDGLLEREEEGYYNTWFKMIPKKGLSMLPMTVKAMMGRDPEGIDNEMELANFKKFAKELQIIVTLWIAYALLKAAAPDDDKDKKIYNLLVLRQLHDLNRDLTYYLSPSSAAELQKNIFPIARTALNWADAMKAVAYNIGNVEDKNGKEMYDDERTFLKLTKVLPILSNINRIEYYKNQTGL
jgi:hypothetical protein